MLLYKYKSLSNIQHIAELICEQKIHCSTLHDLNDLWEGKFVYSGVTTKYRNGMSVDSSNTEVRSVYDFPHLDTIKICSLSSCKENYLLWAYYADAFKGICVEIEFDNSLIASEQVREMDKLNKVSYKGFYIHKAASFDDEFNMINSDPQMASLLDIVTNKSKHWAHEEEYRLLTNLEKYTIQGQIRNIYIGDRSDPLSRKVVQKIAGSIPVYWFRLRTDWNKPEKSMFYAENL